MAFVKILTELYKYTLRFLPQVLRSNQTLKMVEMFLKVPLHKLSVIAEIGLDLKKSIGLSIFQLIS